MSTLCWVARILSLGTIGFILLFMVGERFDPTALTGRDWSLFIFFPIGLCVGLVLGWPRPLLGGAVAVGSILGFYLVYAAGSGGLPRGGWFLLLALPGFLFIVCGVMRRRLT
jgi:peptidoglycan/LPS O-acetylase OafA/YrhL